MTRASGRPDNTSPRLRPAGRTEYGDDIFKVKDRRAADYVLAALAS